MSARTAARAVSAVRTILFGRANITLTDEDIKPRVIQRIARCVALRPPLLPLIP